MTDSLPPDLGTVLSRAAAIGAGPRRVVASTPEEALGAVLDAVAACISPRRLTITDKSGLRFVVEAASGNLINLLEVSDDTPPELLSRPLQATDLASVAALLGGLFPGAQDIAFSTATPSSAPDPAQPGLTCPAILTQLGLTTVDDAVRDRLGYLIEAAEEALLALFHAAQAPTFMRPDANLPDELPDVVDGLFNASEMLGEQLQKSDILFFDLKGQPDLAIGLARSASGPVALVFGAEALPDIAAFWANMAHVPLVRDIP